MRKLASALLALLLYGHAASAQFLTQLPQATLPLSPSTPFYVVQQGSPRQTPLGNLANPGSFLVTANGITNTLSAWMGYLSGTANPNNVVFNGQVNFGGPTYQYGTNITAPSLDTLSLTSTASGGSLQVFSALAANGNVSGAPNYYVWAGTFSITSDATGTGQHVALHASTVRTSIPAGGSGNMSPLFAASGEMIDETGGTSTVSGSEVNDEFDLFGSAADDFNSEGIRVNLDLIYGRWGASQPTFSACCLIRLRRDPNTGDGLGTDTTSTVNRPIDLGPFATGQYNVATIDLTGWTPNGTYVTQSGTLLGAIAIPTQQRVSWTTDGMHWMAHTGLSLEYVDVTTALFQFPDTGPATFGNMMAYNATTVAGLPNCNSTNNNAVAAVTDAVSPTYGGALTGSGTVHTPVYCNGTSWTSH